MSGVQCTTLEGAQEGGLAEHRKSLMMAHTKVE